MNVVAFLRAEHRRALDIIRQAEKPLDEIAKPSTVDGLFDQLQHALRLHTSAEAEVLYPALARFDEAVEMVDRSYLDDYTLVLMLDDLSEMLVTSPRVPAKVNELKRHFEQHVRRVEEGLFPHAETLCSRAELEEMGTKIEQLTHRGARATAERK